MLVEREAPLFDGVASAETSIGGSEIKASDGMSAEQTLTSLDPAHALRPSLHTPGPRRETAFWLSLIAAVMAHVALIAGITRSHPRTLGAADGNESAIDVEIVDAGDLRAMSTPASAPGASQEAPAAQAAPAPTEPQPEPTTEPTTEPTPETALETAPESPAEPAPQKSAALPALEAQEPQPSPPAAVLPKPAPKPSEQNANEKGEAEAKKQTETKPAPKPALKPPSKLDLSVPFDLTRQGGTSGASASSATRPPGITRSGENDRFGRDVIRALKKTMPPLESVTGKVRVRIFLNESGNVAWVRLIQGSGDRGLDDSVIFSVHQASFPFPPKNATEADRTFHVTYIYRR
jgi:periplasmic protein TonB